MRQRKLNKKTKWLLVALMVVGLAFVRFFEDQIFYDPFAAYFKNDYLNLAFPDYEFWPLLTSMTLRFVLNTFFSLAIVQILFQDKKLTQFAGVLYAVFFVLLVSVFFTLIHFAEQHQYFVLFYVRRFLIQPLFVLLFVPAFYYQRLMQKS